MSADLDAPSSAKMNLYVVDQGCLTPAYDSELCAALARRGHEVTLITAPFRNDESYAFPEEVGVVPLFFRSIRFQGSPRIRRLMKGLSYGFYYYRFLGHLRGKRVDAFHFQWLLVPPIDLFFIRRLRKRYPEAAFVVTVHDVKPLFQLAGRSFIGKILSFVNGIVVHGESARSELISAVPQLDPACVHVIPHGPLHHNGEDAEPASAPNARSALGLPAHKHVGLFFGELKEYKGLDVLVEALAALDETTQAKLTFVVAGKLEDPACQVQLDRFRRSGADIRIRLGYVPTSQVSTWFHAADFVVLPYKSITQSGVLLTALANGSPVIVSDVGELADVVRSTEAGWVVPSGDPILLREALSEVVGMKREELEKVGTRAQALLRLECNWQQIADKTTAIYLCHDGQVRVRLDAICSK